MNYELTADNGKTWTKAETKTTGGVTWIRPADMRFCVWQPLGDDLRVYNRGKADDDISVRPLSPRPQIGGVEIGEGWMTVSGRSVFQSRGGSFREWCPANRGWSRLLPQVAILPDERLAIPADFTAGQPGEHIPLTDIPEDQNGVKLRDEVRKLREPCCECGKQAVAGTIGPCGPKPDYSRLVTPKGRECEMLNCPDDSEESGCWARAVGFDLLVSESGRVELEPHGINFDELVPNRWPFPPETGARIDALLDEIEAKERPDPSKLTLPAPCEGEVVTLLAVNPEWAVRGNENDPTWVETSDGILLDAGGVVGPPDLIPNRSPVRGPRNINPQAIADYIAAERAKRAGAKPASLCPDWKSAADDYREFMELCKTDREIAIHATLAALCDAMAGGGK